MKNTLKLLLVLFSLSHARTVTHQNGVLTLENELVRRRYRTKGDFGPVSFFYKPEKTECLTPQGHWFRLFIDGKTIDSAEFVRFSQADLSHGGREVTVFLLAGNAELCYIVQIFPDSPIIRERLVVVPAKGELVLTPGDQGPGYVFPACLFSPVTALQEVRLASWNREQLPDADIDAFPVQRHFGPGQGNGANLSQCHMYHPDFIDFSPLEARRSKGPVVVGLSPGRHGWIVAYEHGSPDNDPVRRYLDINTTPADSLLAVNVTAARGACLPGEKITRDRPFKTVWVLSGVFDGRSFDAGLAALWDFLFHWQSAQRSTRKPLFYYNTWGWQRDDQREYVNFEQLKQTRQGTDIYGDATVYGPLTYYNVSGRGGPRKNLSPRDVLRNEERLLREIDYAHQLGVDVFVLDDGWFDWMGDWNVDTRAFPNGLGPVKKKLDACGMRLGLWMAPFCLHKNSRVYQDFPEYLAVGRDGQNLKGGWNREMACLVSGYADIFIEKSKKLIDMGCTYFKWDGLDGRYCCAGGHDHGGSRHAPPLRGERYGYELINVVTNIAAQLNEYCPDLVIVYDITEKGRHVGLEFFSQGRFFWMNNGASGYDDLSHYRAKSMRTILSLYHRVVPPVLQTFADYPHNASPYFAQMYNVGSSLLGGGHGFWGDLSEMSKRQRQNVGDILRAYKKTAGTVTAVRPHVSGTVGASPEIFEILDPVKSEGEVVAFSGAAGRHTFRSREIDPQRFLGVLRHAYELKHNRLEFLFEFTEPDAVRPAFILGRNRFGARVVRSTCWLEDISIKDGVLTVRNGAPGHITVFWPRTRGAVDVSGVPDFSLRESGDGVLVDISVTEPGQSTRLKQGKP